ncbi:MAG TPA: DUF2304 domain-containing protein [Acidimicrobiales bacterium]|nr:DUF2304 domain-containing protein [Acidimicrobiales bacterium]
MNAIKVVLILCFLGLLAWAFRNRNRVGLRAGIKVGAVVLTAFAVTAIADPALTTSLAHTLGVADGTDLLLYALVVTFACTTMAGYFRYRHLESRLAQVVRSQAITDALLRDGPPGAARRSEPPAVDAPVP